MTLLRSGGSPFWNLLSLLARPENNTRALFEATPEEIEAKKKSKEEKEAREARREARRRERAEQPKDGAQEAEQDDGRQGDQEGIGHRVLRRR